MPPTSTNGNAASARDMLDHLGTAVEQLEADLSQQRDENRKLREERDEYRRILVDQVKHLLDRPEDWHDFEETAYTLTVDDLLAVLNSK